MGVGSSHGVEIFQSCPLLSKVHVVTAATRLKNNLTPQRLNSKAPDVPELAHQGIFQLSRLSVNCCVKNERISPSFKPYRFYENTVSTAGSFWKSYNDFFEKLFMVITYF